MATRTCPGCQKAMSPREPESLIQEYVEGGPTKSYLGCSDCALRINGTPKPERAPYQSTAPEENTFICGICRETFHSDSVAEVGIRLHPDDLTGDDKNALGLPIKPGHYLACAACVEKYRPKIAKRLKMEPAEVVGGWLM